MRIRLQEIKLFVLEARQVVLLVQLHLEVMVPLLTYGKAAQQAAALVLVQLLVLIILSTTMLVRLLLPHGIGEL